MTNKKYILDDFEHANSYMYDTDHRFVHTYAISLSNEQSKVGTSSLKVEYHFGGWSSGNGAMYVKFIEDLSTTRRPFKLGVWIFSDSKTPWLRATIIDGMNERKTVNLTSGTCSWRGWKYLDAAIDSSWRLPLQLEQLYAVETDKTLQGDSTYSGRFYIDQLQFVYVDDEDLCGPIFSEIYPEKDSVYKDTFTFQATVTDAKSGVDPNSIRMLVNNEQVCHTYCDRLNRITYLFDRVEQGIYHVTVKAMDLAGNNAVPPLEKIIHVDLCPDDEKPILTNVTPTQTATVFTPTPRITFNLIDEKSGIDSKDICVTIDSIKQKITYDEETGWAYAVSKKHLADGLHHVTIMATDRSGNKLGPIHYQFTSKALNETMHKNNFKVAVIPDTHSAEYTQVAFCSAIEAQTDFIIQMGDLVDQATENEFTLLEESLVLLHDKPLLTVPGNHEAFQGNLDMYKKLFGSPTFHFNYGHTLFIFLNTAYDQSIHKSDSTQFHYIEHLLAKNTKSNIIVVTHVPTRDRFGTSHEMDKEDAERLEKILGTYKQKNPTTQLTVLFGHLHVLDSWQVDGVNYMITGNGASKGYVSHEQGNIVGHGVLHITPSRTTYEFIPYIAQVSFVKDGLQIDEICLVKGTTDRLNVQATIKICSSNYTVAISDFDVIKKKWTTMNDSVVHVNQNGIVQALASGKTSVFVEVCGKQVKVIIEVI